MLILSVEQQRQLESCQVLIVGASAGAVEALSLLLPAVPHEARIPIVVVVHLPPNRQSLLPELFATRCAARVREPLDKEPMNAGTIWFAPSNYHLLIEADCSFSLSIDEPVNFSRPSIDVLFESAAEALGSPVCALVLTGANEDGARGAAAVRNRGGFVIAQDPSTAVAPCMPSATISRANPQIIATLPEIADLIRVVTRAAHE
jgi:two-component system chemotaxis response regulator CheB